MSTSAPAVAAFKAKVVDGKIAVPEGAEWLEGAEVEVVVKREPAPGTFNDEFREFIGIFDGPPDMAENHDHYAHGAPKRAGT